jgi:hypothetical protein
MEVLPMRKKDIVKEEVWKYLSDKDKILYLLYAYGKLGFNEIVKKGGLHERTVSKYTHPEKGLLVKEGLVKIEVEDIGAPLPKKHRVPTMKGVNHVKRNVHAEEVVYEVLKLFKSRVNEEKFEIFERIFEYLFRVVMKTPEDIHLLDNAFRQPLQDLINRELLERQDDVLKGNDFYLIDENKQKKNKLKMVLKKQKHLWSPMYSDPEFEWVKRELAIRFVIFDGQVAWDKKHWLNVHHRWFFERFGEHSRIEIKKRNGEWLTRHKGKTKDEMLEIRKNEILERKRELEGVKERMILIGDVPNWLNINLDDYGDWHGDVH